MPEAVSQNVFDTKWLSMCPSTKSHSICPASVHSSQPPNSLMNLAGPPMMATSLSMDSNTDGPMTSSQRNLFSGGYFDSLKLPNVGQ